MYTRIETMSDKMFEEYLVFKTIELWEVPVDAAVVDALIGRKREVKFHNMVIPRDGRTVREWTKAVFEALINNGILSEVTAADVDEFFERRDEAIAMAPKGKEVRYG